MQLTLDFIVAEDFAQNKKCRKCGVVKITSDFRVNRAQCKSCEITQKKQYLNSPKGAEARKKLNEKKRKKHASRLIDDVLKRAEYEKTYREKNSDKLKAQRKEWKSNNPEKVKAQRKRRTKKERSNHELKNKILLTERNKHIAENSVEISALIRKLIVCITKNKDGIERARLQNIAIKKEKARTYREQNEEKLRVYRKQFYEKNKTKLNRQVNLSRMTRKKIDPILNLKLRIRKTIGGSFSRMGYTKSAKSFEILGIDWDGLTRYFEAQFHSGMTWDNRGEYWHIDHFIPIATARTEHEVIKLNHFSNLRPMLASDNLKKRDAMPTQNEIIEHEKMIARIIAAIGISIQ